MFSAPDAYQDSRRFPRAAGFADLDWRPFPRDISGGLRTVSTYTGTGITLITSTGRA